MGLGSVNLLQMIGNRIKELRINKLNLSEEKFAEILNMNQNYLYEVETGSQDISVNELIFVCSKLGVSLNEFFSPFTDILNN